MLRNALAISAALILTACGGGSLELVPSDQTIGIPANGNRSGYVKSDGDVYKTATSNLYIRVGDYFDNKFARGFLSFPISGIPAGATILEANLYVTQQSVTNTPYAQLGGQILVDHVKLGAALSSGDFSTAGASTITNSIGIISLDDVLEQKGLDVLPEVLADIAAARNNSEFRMRFPVGTNNDNGTDWARFNTPEDKAGNGTVPVLVIRYEE